MRDVWKGDITANFTTFSLSVRKDGEACWEESLPVHISGKKDAA